MCVSTISVIIMLFLLFLEVSCYFLYFSNYHVISSIFGRTLLFPLFLAVLCCFFYFCHYHIVSFISGSTLLFQLFLEVPCCFLYFWKYHVISFISGCIMVISERIMFFLLNLEASCMFFSSISGGIMLFPLYLEVSFWFLYFWKYHVVYSISGGIMLVLLFLKVSCYFLYFWKYHMLFPVLYRDKNTANGTATKSEIYYVDKFTTGELLLCSKSQQINAVMMLENSLLISRNEGQTRKYFTNTYNIHIHMYPSAEF